MAFDWTKVEGYNEEMTADEKLSLLENYSEPAPEAPGKNFVSKTQYDKVSSELAGLKKELRSRMSKEEADANDREAAVNAMQTELEQLRKEKTLATYTTNYLAQGYTKEMAEMAAQAMVDGDMDGMFAVMKKQATLAEKNLREKILKDTPVPPAGDDSAKEAIRKKEELNVLRKSMGLSPL